MLVTTKSATTDNMKIYEETNQFRTDALIAQSREGEAQPRHLEPWDSGSVPTTVQAALEEQGGQTNWDQFEVNSRRFQVKSTYQEDMYTTPLDVESIPKSFRDKADQLAREIETSHQRQPSDDEEDEEKKFAAVQRPEESTVQPVQSQALEVEPHSKKALKSDKKMYLKSVLNEAVTKNQTNYRAGKPGYSISITTTTAKCSKSGSAKGQLFSSPLYSRMLHHFHLVKNINALNLEPAMSRLHDREQALTSGATSATSLGRMIGSIRMTREQDKAGFIEDLKCINEQMKKIHQNRAAFFRQHVFGDKGKYANFIRTETTSELKQRDASRLPNGALIDFPALDKSANYREPINQIILQSLLPQVMKENLEQIRPIWNFGLHPSIPRLNSYQDVLSSSASVNVPDQLVESYTAQRNSICSVQQQQQQQRPKQMIYTTTRLLPVAPTQPSGVPVDTAIQPAPPGYPADHAAMAAPPPIDPSCFMIVHPNQAPYLYPQQGGGYYPHYMYGQMYIPPMGMIGQYPTLPAQPCIGKGVPPFGVGNPGPPPASTTGLEYMYQPPPPPPPPHMMSSDEACHQLPQNGIAPYAQMYPYGYQRIIQNPNEMYGKFVPNGNIHMMPKTIALAAPNFPPAVSMGSPVCVNDQSNAVGHLAGQQSMSSQMMEGGGGGGNGNSEENQQTEYTTRLNQPNGDSGEFSKSVPMSPSSPSGQYAQCHHYYPPPQNGGNIYFIPQGPTVYGAPRPPPPQKMQQGQSHDQAAYTNMRQSSMMKWHLMASSPQLLPNRTRSTSNIDEALTATQGDMKPMVLYEPMMNSTCTESNAALYAPNPGNPGSAPYMHLSNAGYVPSSTDNFQAIPPTPHSPSSPPSRGPSNAQRYMQHTTQHTLPPPQGNPPPHRSMITMPMHPPVTYFTSPSSQNAPQQPMNKPPYMQ